MSYSKNELGALLFEINKRLSQKRFFHTIGVMECAARLAWLCMPEYESEAQVAALLHDVTKELPREEQTELLSPEELSLFDGESEGILHAFSAPAVIKRDFPSFSAPLILNAVRNHTTGAPDMSVFDEIIFLADFIENGREYEASIKTREFVFSEMKLGKYEENIKILHKACLMEIDSTIESLERKNKSVCGITLRTREALEKRI